jgi:hypothetical protein
MLAQEGMDRGRILKIWAIDPFTRTSDWYKHVGPFISNWKKDWRELLPKDPSSDLEWLDLFYHFARKTGTLDSLHPLKQDLIVAADFFEDETIDLISFQSEIASGGEMLLALERWWHKIKMGGILIIKDYGLPSIFPAITEAVHTFFNYPEEKMRPCTLRFIKISQKGVEDSDINLSGSTTLR